MVNYIDSNLDPVLWAEAAVRSNWTAAQLRLVEKVAAKLFQSHPEVSPEIRFVVQRLDYRPFIATGSVPNLSAIPRIGLLINYRAAQLSEHEWENMLKHELNHAKARRTTDFVSPKVLPNPNDKNQYRRNAFHVFRSLFTDQENVTLDKIAPNINMLKEHLAIIIDEVLADALIPPDPITPIRYQKVINQLILSNDTLGEEWIGRVKAIADIFGVKIDMETANAKAIGNPKAREAGYKLAKLAWALKDRLVFKYDPSSNTFTIER